MDDAEIVQNIETPKGDGAYGFAAMFRSRAYTPDDQEMVAVKFDALGAKIDRLNAELARLREEQRWRPITDDVRRTNAGSDFGPLILLAVGGEVICGRWWDARASIEQRWRNFLDDRGHVVHPSAWRPLPDPPEAK